MVEKNQTQKSDNKIKEIKKFLKENNIIFPKNFDEIIEKKANIYYGGILPEIEAIRAVLKTCEVWKLYCANENEFACLVIKKIYTMAEIRAAVISSNEGGETYIGNYCLIKNGKELPDCMTTIASANGATGISTRFGAPIEKF